jgi:hypothetical protein
MIILLEVCECLFVGAQFALTALAGIARLHHGLVCAASRLPAAATASLHQSMVAVAVA